MQDFYHYIISHNEILNLAISFISLIVSIFLTIGIYKLERRHIKTHEIAEARARAYAISESARVFI